MSEQCQGTLVKACFFPVLQHIQHTVGTQLKVMLTAAMPCLLIGKDVSLYNGILSLL